MFIISLGLFLSFTLVTFLLITANWTASLSILEISGTFYMIAMTVMCLILTVIQFSKVSKDEYYRRLRGENEEK